jgi:uncharacterized repeat protein (TIGR04002 family)
MRGRAGALTFSGIFAALVFAATFFLHIPVGFGGGYVHAGDSFVFLAASVLPAPLAMAASAIGAGLSDLMTPGAAAWLLPTVIVKSLSCLPFSSKSERILTRRNLLALPAAAAISLTGYGAATAVMSGSIAVAIAEIPLSLAQSFAGAVGYIAVGAALDKANIKQYIGGNKP